MNKALVVIDLQNDITKHYRSIIDNVNEVIAFAQSEGMTIAYIRHNNLGENVRAFRPGSKGEQLVPELHVVSPHQFVKTKSNALTSEAFLSFIQENGLNEFYLVGADATACVKSTALNMKKAGYAVTTFTDCITSYDEKKLPEMFAYYEKIGCIVTPLNK